MASSKEYLQFMEDQFSLPREVAFKPMMGEYILYFRDRIVGGIYDDRLLVKPVPAALALMPDAPREPPYPGAKEMLLVEDVDNGDFLRELLLSMYDEIEPRKEKSKRKTKAQKTDTD